MKFTKAFHKIVRTKGRVRVIQGSSGSSKTYSILQYLIILCSKAKKPITISVVAESFPHLRRGAMKDFFDILKAEGIYSEKFHNKTNNSYVINDCTIEFFSADDGGKLRGARRDVLFVNEGNNISREAFVQLEMRTKGGLTFVDFNPSHLSWIRDYIEEDGSNFVKLTYKDNQYLSKANIQTFKDAMVKAEAGSAWWKNFVRVYVYGEEGSVTGSIYQFDLIKEVPETAEYLGTGLDFGWGDPNAVVKVWKDGENDVILQEFLYKGNLMNNQLYNHLAVDVDITKNIIVCDNARPEIIADLKNRGLIVKAIKKPLIIDRITLGQNYNLKVVEGSENLLHELRNYVWDTDKDDNKIDVPKPNQQDHLCDAFSYLIYDRLSARLQQYNKLRFA